MSSQSRSSPSPPRPSAKPSASEYGRRGAAERERRFYARCLPHLTESKRQAAQIREDRRRLKAAIAILTQVFGRPFRPRRRPPLPVFLAMVPAAVDAILDVSRSPDIGLRGRASFWGLFVASSLSEDPWWGSPSPRDYWVQVKKA